MLAKSLAYSHFSLSSKLLCSFHQTTENFSLNWRGANQTSFNIQTPNWLKHWSDWLTNIQTPKILYGRNHPVDMTNNICSPAAPLLLLSNIFKVELPKVTFGDILADPTIRPKGEFNLVRWESRLPPYRLTPCLFTMCQHVLMTSRKHPRQGRSDVDCSFMSWCSWKIIYFSLSQFYWFSPESYNTIVVILNL